MPYSERSATTQPSPFVTIFEIGAARAVFCAIEGRLQKFPKTYFPGEWSKGRFDPVNEEIGGDTTRVPLANISTNLKNRLVYQYFLSS